MNTTKNKRGVAPRLFGAIFIMLGAMNYMLAWRGSFAPGELHLLLIGSGLVVFCIGAIMARRPTEED